MSSYNAVLPFIYAASIIGFLTYLGGFIVAIMWRRRSTAASNYVVAGISVHMFNWLVGLLGPALAARTLGSSGMPGFLGLFQLFSATMFAIGIAFLVAAAFVDRRPIEAAEAYLPGDRKSAAHETNPYAASEPK